MNILLGKDYLFTIYNCLEYDKITKFSELTKKKHYYQIRNFYFFINNFKRQIKVKITKSKIMHVIVQILHWNLFKRNHKFSFV